MLIYIISKDLTAFAGYSLLYFYKIMLELLDAMRIVAGFALPQSGPIFGYRGVSPCFYRHIWAGH